MNRIKLLKAPGYIYDLNFIFCLKFNKELYIENLPNDNEKETSIACFKEVSNQFGDISDDLFVFFHAIETERAFLPTYYFNPYRDHFATDYNFQFLQKELSDQGRLIRNLIKFYFCELDDETVEQCAASSSKIFEHIKDSDYSGEEKLKLYEFFMNPSRYIQLLQFELVQKEFKLSEYYKNNYQKIIDLYNQTSFESLREQLKHFEDLVIDDNTEILYISYCLLNKFCMSIWFTKESLLPLVGCEYVTMLGHNRGINRDKQLYNFATALSEESRIKMLRFLIEQNEVTCKDLERKFKFSGSTAYHHISIMTKSGLVKARSEGKTIFYSINKKYIKEIMDVLNKIIKRRGKQK